MKVTLFDFQKDALNDLRKALVKVRQAVSPDDQHVVAFSAATGSGKTFTMLGREGEVKGMNETCLEVYLVLSLVSLPEVCTRLSKRLQNHGLFRRNLQRIHNRPAQAEEQRLP